MGKVSIVYWSGTGNTEAMAAAMAEGAKDAGAEVELLTVDKADAAALSEAKAFALGCPAMGAEVLEEGEMEPFMTELDSQIAGKTIALWLGRRRVDARMGVKNRCRWSGCFIRRGYNRRQCTGR